MRNTIVSIILIIFSVGARSELALGPYERFIREDNISAHIANLPNEESILENQIMAAVSANINNSLIKVRDVESEFYFRGKTITKVSCFVLNKPCIAYLERVGDEWEVVNLTTAKSLEPHRPLAIDSN